MQIVGIYPGKHEHQEGCELGFGDVSITGVGFLKLYTFLDAVAEFVLSCGTRFVIRVLKIADTSKVRPSRGFDQKTLEIQP